MDTGTELCDIICSLNMVRRMPRIFLRTFACLLGLMLLVLTMFVLRVAIKPISLNFLTPHLETALVPKGSPYSVRLNKVVLDWTNRRGLYISALGATVIDEGGGTIISVPRISVAISGRALLRGLIAPKKIQLQKPDIYLTVGPMGNVELRVGKGEEREASTIISRILAPLLTPHDPAYPSSYVDSFSVWDGNLVIKDLRSGISWHAPETELSFKRAREGMRIEASFGVETLGRGDAESGPTEKEVPHFFIEGFYPRSGEALSLTTRFTGLEPALLAQLSPALSSLKGIDIPTRGAFTLSVDKSGKMLIPHFHLSGEKGGVLHLTSVPAGSIRVDNLHIGGEINRDLASIRIDEFAADVGDIGVKGNGTIDSRGETLVVEGNATVERFAVNQFNKYWPPVLLPSIRSEVLSRLKNGSIERATTSFTIEVNRGGDNEGNKGEDKDGEPGNIKLKNIDGAIDFTGITAVYLQSMPPVRDASGTATLSNDGLGIEVAQGEIDGVSIKDGKVIIRKRNGSVPLLAVTIHTQGSLKDVVRVLENPPVEIATLTHLHSEGMSGGVDAQIAVDVPLTNEIGDKDINITTTAKMLDAGTGRVGNKSIGIELSNGEVNLKLNKRGKDFNLNLLVNSLAVNSYPYLGGMVSGNLSIENKTDTEKRLKIALNLLDASIKLNDLGWSKESGTPGSATLSLELQDGIPKHASKLAIESDGLEIIGNAKLSSDKLGPAGIDLRRLVVGKNDLAASVLISTTTEKEKEYNITIRGKTLDARPFINEERESRRDGQHIELPPYNIDVKLDQILAGGGKKIENVSGIAAYDGKRWKSIATYGKISGKPIVLLLSPNKGEKGREITLKAEDAGATLRAFNIYKRMKGGRLRIKANLLDETMVGKLVVKDCILKKAPILTKIFTIASLTGVANLIAGEGIQVDRIKVYFTKTANLIKIRDAHAWGSNIGITVNKGYIDLNGDSMNLAGVLVPAYTLNKFINAIPLLGKLITGGEGSGIIAANYRISGTINNPDINVNPLSVLAPGIIRGFVNALTGSGAGAKDAVKEQHFLAPSP